MPDTAITIDVEDGYATIKGVGDAGFILNIAQVLRMRGMGVQISALGSGSSAKASEEGVVTARELEAAFGPRPVVPHPRRLVRRSTIRKVH
jgi:hypothetical protein